MQINRYEDMTIEVMSKPENAGVLTGLALNITMHTDKDFDAVTKTMCEFLINAEHMSVFEHANYTFLIQSISRSLLAQITRQRTASITSGSQHYQDYSNYPVSTAEAMQTEYPSVALSLSASIEEYKHLLTSNVPREEARQVLPNASTVNILWTLDARNLFYFLRQRMCNRNVLEMRIFAWRLYLILKDDFPALFSHAGPQCSCGPCRQGRMQCKAGVVESPI